MEQEKVTLDLIMNQMKEWVEGKVPVQPSVWLDAALKLNVLLEDLDDEIAHKRYELAVLESQHKRVVEHGRLAKKMADLKSYQ